MKHILRSTLILVVFFAIDKALALVRQVAIARSFGQTPQLLDAFNAANNLPDLLFALISGGALAIAFIPVLSLYLEQKSQPAAWDLFSRIANLAFLVTAGLAIVIALLADPLVRFELGIAPGFGPEQQSLVADLMRLNLVATLIFSISGLVMAGLQANQHFLLPAMAPALYNLGQIFGALVLAPQAGLQLGPLKLPALGLGVHGLVYGVILGAILHLGIQIPGLLRYHFHWKPAIGLRNPGVRQVLALMGPRLVTMLFIQLIFLARDNLASRLESGALSALTYGWFIMQVPETLIGTALATVLLPTLSEQVARNDRAAFQRTLNQAVRVILALTIPSAVLLAAAIRPVAGIFGFDAAVTELLVWSARAYLAGIAGHSLLELASRAFYAQQNARIPLFTAAFRISAFLLLGVIFLRPLGVAGIALADTLAITSEAIILLFLLNRRFPGVLQVGGTLARAALVSLGGGLLVFALLQLPLPALVASLAALAAGGLLALPFIWPEVKLLIKL
jgi:putative peptidoglycan lipid II flippase